MANVYIEPRPKARREGDPIDDYVVEDHAWRLSKRSRKPSSGQASRSHAFGRARQAFERQEKAQPLAFRIGAYTKWQFSFC